MNAAGLAGIFAAASAPETGARETVAEAWARRRSEVHPDPEPREPSTPKDAHYKIVQRSFDRGERLIASSGFIRASKLELRRTPQGTMLLRRTR